MRATAAGAEAAAGEAVAMFEALFDALTALVTGGKRLVADAESSAQR